MAGRLLGEANETEQEQGHQDRMSRDFFRSRQGKEKHWDYSLDHTCHAAGNFVGFCSLMHPRGRACCDALPRSCLEDDAFPLLLRVLAAGGSQLNASSGVALDRSKFLAQNFVPSIVAAQ